MEGIINILKPPGMTSHDVVSRVRRLAKTKRVGHTGTLDPGAAGVLPVCVGRATRVSEYVLQMDKTYRAELLLGLSTDTGDASGLVTATQEVPALDEAQVRGVLEGFLGPGLQVPPMYSALRKDGIRLYELARRGHTVEREARPIHIYKIGLVALEGARIIFDVTCSRGTYVRTLCADIAERLGTYGHLSFLLRTAVGPFLLEDAHTLEELAHFSENASLEKALLPLDTALLSLPSCVLSVAEAAKIVNGQPVARHDLPEGKLVRIYNERGDFLAVGRVASGLLSPEKVFFQV